MSIHVKLFASLAERFGLSEQTIEREKVQTVEDVWRIIADGDDIPENLLMAVNMEYVSIEAPVSDGDEVAFFPPITGGER